MIYFSDVDVVMKLARCGFLPWLPDLLGLSKDEIHVKYLASMRARLTRPSKKLTNATYQKHLEEFCASYDVIGTAADITRQEQLLQSGMDSGEALLFAEAEASGGIVVTGDKRAIKQYARHSTVGQRAKLKVVCFEQLLLRVHQLKGYEELKRGGCEYLEDGLLSLAFSSGLATQETQAIEAIRSYLIGLKESDVDFLFVFEPDI